LWPFLALIRCRRFAKKEEKRKERRGFGESPASLKVVLMAVLMELKGA
jgi:hypothetical protein